MLKMLRTSREMAEAVQMSGRTARLNNKVKNANVPDMLEPVVGTQTMALFSVQWTMP